MPATKTIRVRSGKPLVEEAIAAQPPSRDQSRQPQSLRFCAGFVGGAETQINCRSLPKPDPQTHATPWPTADNCTIGVRMRGARAPNSETAPGNHRDRVWVHITDTGSGISRIVCSNVMEPILFNQSTGMGRGLDPKATLKK